MPETTMYHPGSGGREASKGATRRPFWLPLLPAIQLKENIS